MLGAFAPRRGCFATAAPRRSLFWGLGSKSDARYLFGLPSLALGRESPGHAARAGIGLVLVFLHGGRNLVRGVRGIHG